jgi:hypothetical protein
MFHKHVDKDLLSEISNNFTNHDASRVLYSLDDDRVAKYLNAIGAHLENIIDDIKAQARLHNAQVKLTDYPDHNKWKAWYQLVQHEYQNRGLLLKAEKPENTKSTAGIVEGAEELKQSLIKCITEIGTSVSSIVADKSSGINKTRLDEETLNKIKTLTREMKTDSQAMEKFADMKKYEQIKILNSFLDSYSKNTLQRSSIDGLVNILHTLDKLAFSVMQTSTAAHEKQGMFKKKGVSDVSKGMQEIMAKISNAMIDVNHHKESSHQSSDDVHQMPHPK